MTVAATQLPSITDQEYDFIRSLVYDRFGIHLGQSKRSLVISRLHKVLKEKNFRNFHDYYDYLLTDTSGEALSTLIDQISTNHTYFNREEAHFKFFKDFVLPELLPRLEKQGNREIRIWSAGCSSGDEPFTLAMTLLDYLNYRRLGWKVAILGTDISEKALSVARKGIYTRNQISRLPLEQRKKYFKPISNNLYQVKDILKNLVLYRRLNLMRDYYPFKKKFHSIWCRNVMIYFDLKTRTDLVRKFHNYLDDDGYLFIGHSETLTKSSRLFQYIQPAVYRKLGEK